jgi:hypothetical protein
MAWKRDRTGAGDKSVEAAGLGRGLQEGTGNRGRPGVGGNREITLGGSWDGTLGAWTTRQQGTRGPAGQWREQTPTFKDVSKVGNCIHLGDTCGRQRPYKGSRNNLKAMDDLILCGRCRDRKVGIAEFNRFGDNLAFCVSTVKFEAVVQLQGWTNVEAILGTKVPRPARCWLSMDEDATTNLP